MSSLWPDSDFLSAHSKQGETITFRDLTMNVMHFYCLHWL